MHNRKKKVLVLCPSPRGTAATQRLKYEQYIPGLEKSGYQFTISNFQSNRFWKIIYKPGHTLEKVFWVTMGYLRRTFDLLRAPFYDVIFVNLWVTPLGPPLFERLFCLFRKKIIYDIDDMLFKTGSGHGKQSIIQKLKGTKKPIVLMKNATYVIVCTPKLEEIALSLNKYKNVVDISSTFDTQRFVPANKEASGKPLVIGWTGTHSTLPFLDLIQPALSKLVQERSFTLKVIANKYYQMEGVPTEYIDWNADTEVADLHTFDIGLYPIPANEWSLGKSSLKALTYMAIGIPFVATAYGTNYRIMEDGVQGFMALEQDEWVEKLKQLIDNFELRQEMGIMGRKRVVEQYSTEANLPKYLNAFKAITS